MTDETLQAIIQVANNTRAQIECVYVFYSADAASDTREAFAFVEKPPGGAADG